MCVLFQANLPEQINGAAATASEGPNYESLHVVFFAKELGFYIRYHGLFIGIWLQGAEFGPCFLRGVRQSSSRGSCKACVVSECGNAPTARVGQKFQVVQDSISTVESAKNRGPARLFFVAVRKLHVRMRKWRTRDWELLQTDDRHIGRGPRPGVVLNKFASDADRSCQQDPAENLFE